MVFFFGDGFGEASDDVMENSPTYGQKEMENCHPATGDASFIANGRRLQSCLGRLPQLVALFWAVRIIQRDSRKVVGGPSRLIRLVR